MDPGAGGPGHDDHLRDRHGAGHHRRLEARELAGLVDPCHHDLAGRALLLARAAVHLRALGDMDRVLDLRRIRPLAGAPAFDYPFLSNAVYYGFLLALTIVLSSLGGWLLGMRNMMVSTLSEDYILTAEAKGLDPRRIMVMYAARNAMLPSVSGFAISLGFVVSGSIVVETVFSYPGIGYTMLQAVNNNDYSLMQGLFLVITISVLAANLVVDLLYGIIDPRTRARG